jgi:hypothetical protein
MQTTQCVLLRGGGCHVQAKQEALRPLHRYIYVCVTRGTNTRVPAAVQVPAEGKAGPVGSVCALPSEWQKAELAVDGPSLNFILADDSMRHKLAVLAAHCSGVVVSRSSPSQKAAIVKMMTKYEMWKAAGSSRGLTRWYAMHRRRLQVRGLRGGARERAGGEPSKEGRRNGGTEGGRCLCLCCVWQRWCICTV